MLIGKAYFSWTHDYIPIFDGLMPVCLNIPYFAFVSIDIMFSSEFDFGILTSESFITESTV